MSNYLLQLLPALETMVNIVPVLPYDVAPNCESFSLTMSDFLQSTIYASETIQGHLPN